MADDGTTDLFDGKSKGGKARAAALTQAERKEIAQRAAVARWHGDLPGATHEGELRIADFTLHCAVLDDGRRVLSERGVLRALGIHYGGAQFKRGLVEGPGDTDGDAVRLPMFVAGVNLRPFIDNELLVLLTQPIRYRLLQGGRPGRGLEATLIPKVCEVWLKARDAKALRANQLRIAARADMLVRGLARTGIIALVDEATGYQEVRDRFALQAILDAYLSRELAAWAKRFPDEYFHEIFRLRGWAWDELRLKAGKGDGVDALKRVLGCYVLAHLPPDGLAEALESLRGVWEYHAPSGLANVPRLVAQTVQGRMGSISERPRLVLEDE